MAGTRLERIGTIYTRASGLLKSGALNWEDRPLWYDIYEAFPPKEEPRYDRPIPNIKLKQIFYEEDKIRALFHRNNKQIGATNLFNNTYRSLTQRFIETYQRVQQTSGENLSEETLYTEAIEILKKEKELRKEVEEDEPVSLSSAFKEAKRKQDDNLKIKIDVAEFFKT